MFSFITRGLDRPEERRSLAACLILLVTYLMTLGIMLTFGSRIDTKFLAQRELVRFARARGQHLGVGVPVTVIANGVIAAPIVLLTGWSLPEPWGIWTNGATAELAVSLPSAWPAASVLQLRGIVVLPQTGVQTLEVQEGNAKVGRWSFTGRGAVLCLPLPQATPKQDGLLHIQLHIETPVQPGGPDSRDLGFGLERIELMPSADCTP
jgi:hypothetical protein